MTKRSVSLIIVTCVFAALLLCCGTLWAADAPAAPAPAPAPAAPAAAAPAPATPPAAAPAGLKVGVVDFDTVGKQYQEYTARVAEMQKWIQDRQRYLDELQQFIFLSAENFNEVVSIYALPLPWPADKAARLKELQKLNDDKDAEYRGLNAKSNRDAKEQERFNSLAEIARGRQGQLQDITDKLKAEIAEKQSTLQNGITGKVQDVIVQVAKELGYTLILDKAFVYFGGEDISAAVIDRLNKATPAAPAAPAEGGNKPGGGK